MIHAREDYNRIQDPANKIPADEPVFLLRAQDVLACKAVAYYAELCKASQAPEVAAKAEGHAKRMAEWPVKKVPDLPSAGTQQEAQPQAEPAGGDKEDAERFRFCLESEDFAVVKWSPPEGWQVTRVEVLDAARAAQQVTGERDHG